MKYQQQQIDLGCEVSMFQVEDSSGARVHEQRFYTKGRCVKSPYSDGSHMAILMPFKSLLDGGLSGDVYRKVCKCCGKDFKADCFLPIKQPSRLANDPN